MQRAACFSVQNICHSHNGLPDYLPDYAITDSSKKTQKVSLLNLPN